MSFEDFGASSDFEANLEDFGAPQTFFGAHLSRFSGVFWGKFGRSGVSSAFLGRIWKILGLPDVLRRDFGGDPQILG